MRFGQPLFIPPPASLSRNLFRICASREEGRLVAEPLLCALSRWGDDADAAYRRGMRRDSTDGRRAGPGTVRGRRPADGADILIEVFLLRGGASGPGSDRICGLSAGGGDWPSQGFGGAPLPPALPRPACAPSGAGRAAPRGFSAHGRPGAGVRLPVPVAPARRAKTLRRPPADPMSWGFRGSSAGTDARRSAGERPRKRRPG